MIGRRWLAPWLWLLPAAAFIGVFLVYPVVDTIRISLMNSNSTAFVGVDNYTFIFTQRATQTALLNNLLWLFFFTSLTVGLGLILAVLTDRVRYEAVAKAVIFVPMAISFVAAAVIWRFMYEFKPEGFTQLGTVNAALVGMGGSPEAWLVDTGPASLPRPLQVNNFAIIVAGVWMWTGFAMVVLSAGLKGISGEVLEAARVDGANEWQIFRYIILPMLYPTIAVVATTLVINALKKFDLVWVMTAGNFDTDLVATLMYKEMFNFRQFGRAGALAVVLLVAILPIMLISIRRFRAQEETR